MYKSDVILDKLQESLAYNAPETHEAHWAKARQEIRAIFEGSTNAEANWTRGRDLVVFDDGSSG